MKAPTQLTPDQVRAVQDDAPSCLVIAPAGSGKTEVLIRRVLRILSESEGESFRLLVVTYTVKAAEELRERVRAGAGSELWRVDAETIHGFALDWIRRFGRSVGVPPDVVVYSSRTDRADLLTKYLLSIGVAEVDPRAVQSILDVVDGMPGALESAQAFDLPVPVEELVDAYAQALEQAGGVDFAGMLTKFVSLLEADPGVARRFRRTYRHVLVDEGQDLTKIQCELLRSLISEEVYLFVVADDRQSINRWVGGGMEWARALVGSDAVELHLQHNFRCATRILEIAHHIAEHFVRPRSDATAPPGAPPGRVEVRSAATEGGEATLVAEWADDLVQRGLPPDALVEGESPVVAPEDIAVVGRSRFVLDPTVQELETRGYAVSVLSDGGSLLGSAEGRVVHALIEVRANPRDLPAARRLIEEVQNLIPVAFEPEAATAPGAIVRSIAAHARETPVAALVRLVDQLDPTVGASEFSRLLREVPVPSDGWGRDVESFTHWWREYHSATHAQDRTLVGFVRHLFQVQRTRPDDPGIRVLTTHRAKGLEFRAVAVVGLNQGGFPDYRSERDPEALDEERRAFYVAVTRASRALLLTWPRQRTYRYGSTRSVMPSQFFREAQLVDDRRGRNAVV